MLAAARSVASRVNARAAAMPLGAAILVGTTKNTAADLIVQTVRSREWGLCCRGQR